jgi:hypothetical protein
MDVLLEVVTDEHELGHGEDAVIGSNAARRPAELIERR